MKIIETGIPDLFIIEPRVFPDSRGYFFESYSKQALEENGLNYNFVQDNQSKSSYGVIRGLHYQLPPHAQTKLVRVVQGAVWDVAVDIRKGSPTFGKWFGVELTEDNKRQFLIPRGFAHGFSVLSQTAVFFYKCDEFYHPGSEASIKYNDGTLNVDWKIEAASALVSDKDERGADFSSCKNTFEYKK